LVPKHSLTLLIAPNPRGNGASMMEVRLAGLQEVVGADGAARR
jgi:hypothetical protein